MNILFVWRNIPQVELGGVDRVSCLLAAAFAERGDRSFFAYTKSTEEPTDPETTIQIDRQKPETLHRFIVAHNIDWVLYQFGHDSGLIDLLAEACRGSRAKIITAYHSKPGYETLNLIDDLRRKKAVGFVAGFKRWVKLLLPGRYVEGVRRRCVANIQACYRASERVVLLSESFKEEFAQINELPDRAKLVAIPNPLTFAESFDPEQLDKKEPLVLFVGALWENPKRVSLILQIWQLVERDLRSKDWKLELVGAGNDRSYYEQLARELELKRVTFVGRQDPEPYYRRASLFMMSSLYEGMPMVLLEAEQMGVVPVAFDTFSSLHDVVVDGRNGVVVVEGDQAQYAQQIVALMTDPTRRKEMAQNAIADSEQQFNIQKIIDRWVEVLR